MTSGGHPVCITASAGVGLYPVHGEDALTKSVDLALYEAKRAGKSAWRMAQRDH